MPCVVRNAGFAGSTTNVTGLNSTNNLSVAIWCRLTGTGGACDIMRHASTANVARDGFRIGFSNTEFRLDILGATGSNNYGAVQGGRHRDGRWHHFAAVFNTTANTINGYLDGRLWQTTTGVTQNISANASCTTVWNPNILGNGAGFQYFDLQILPDVVVPPEDVPLLMKPQLLYPGVKGRYFGLQFRTSAVGTGACRDESGNGNNLTISTAAFQQGEEPPFRPTFQ